MPAGSRGRWGIGIRDDPANPVAPVVVGIRVGSPAERSQLKIKDRIYGVGGVPITSQQDLMRRLAEVPLDEGVDVLVSRRGQFLKLTCTE